MGSKIKILSLNVNGLHDKIKQKRLRSTLHNLKPELVMLQETDVNRSGNTILGDRKYLRIYPFQYHSKGSSEARDTAILIHKSIQFKETATKKDDGALFSGKRPSK